jgi:hypothetical protein
MSDPGDFRTRTKTFRLTADEEAEIDAHLQRVGGSQSDFFRNAILARARGTVDFAEMLPVFAATLEGQMADLARSLQAQTLGIQTLAAAAVASSAMMLDDGSEDSTEAALRIVDQMKRAVAFAPQVATYLPKAASSPAPAGQSTR